MTIKRSGDEEGAGWVADGYSSIYGNALSRTSSVTGSDAYLTDEPALPSSQPVPKLGTDNVMVLHARSPSHAHLLNPTKAILSPQERRVYHMTRSKMMQMLQKPGVDYISAAQHNTRQRSSRPRSAMAAFTVSKSPAKSPQSSRASSRCSTPRAPRDPRPAPKARPMSAQTPTVARPPTAPRPSPRPESARPRLQNEFMRPGSARARPFELRLRPNSARSAEESARSRSPTGLRKSYTLRSRALDAEKYETRDHSPSGFPSPDATFLDRHWRCFDGAHIHTKLRRDSPTRGCEFCHEQPPNDVTSLEMDRDTRERIKNEGQAFYKIYVDAMRPKSAPSARVSRKHPFSSFHNRT